MKKQIVTIGLILSFDTYAANVCPQGTLNISCWDCGATQSDLCTAQLENNKLTITGSGKMIEYKVNDNLGAQLEYAPWPKSITEVEISGIEEIQQGTFYDFDNLQKVTIGSGVGKIHWYTFTNCDNLSDVTFSDSVNAIGNFAFANNTNLKTLVMPESLFTNGSNGLMWSGIFLHTELENLYCPENHIQECQTALETSSMSNEKISEILKPYKKFGDQYFYQGKFYQNSSDIGTPNYIKKRIYTIDEANKITGTKNRVSIKYR